MVGSGGAGLTAALTAARNGANVLVVESLEIVGGATGVSAGAGWFPAHGYSTKELGIEDSLDDARTYIYGDGRDQTLDHEVIETFLQEGPKVARYIEANTKFGWIPVIWPDYHSDIPGASVGRALFPGPYNADGLGEAARYVRPALTSGMAKNPMPFWALAGLKTDAAQRLRVDPQGPGRPAREVHEARPALAPLVHARAAGEGPLLRGRGPRLGAGHGRRAGHRRPGSRHLDLREGRARPVLGG